ncbi:hypothetical protein BDV24DRAFT_169450 [Aspergillus arachidicola]|uniref:Uncharacterized protein n=1 Tax=Aspergillus arachidicola TaxID=656916 RepID=A0A5N6XPP8_9EURO|nr:hypothetical protein BDV24DRAFT_169450 [Aspergillus arachidicola]
MVTPERIKDCPPPWSDLKANVLICFARSSSSKGPQKPPAASYHDLEETTSFSEMDVVGGLQICVLVEYLDSPVGRYYELLWIPGAFNLPKSGKQTYRATRVYVSSRHSVYNGQKYWNVPKAVRESNHTGGE